MSDPWAPECCPIFINVRDRVSDLRRLVAWLERAGHERIVLLDNASTYEPLVEYLRGSPHDVVWLGRNLGSRALWHADLAPGEHFVWTDPDVVPVDSCPLDAVAHLKELLDHYPDPKAGLGLYLDDVPDACRSLTWEREIVGPDRAIAPGVFLADVDTTFALYRPGAGFTFEALRTGWPYQVRHMPWYSAGRELTAEDRYYLDHANGGHEGSSWKDGRQV